MYLFLFFSICLYCVFECFSVWCLVLFVFIVFFVVLLLFVFVVLLLFVFIVLLLFDFVALLLFVIVLLSSVFVCHCCCFLIDLYTPGQERLYVYTAILYFVCCYFC